MDEESASGTEEVSPICRAAETDQVRENDNDDHDDDDEASDSDDYDLMTMEAPLMVSNSIVEKQQQKQQERPLTGFTWNTNAITECLALSLQAHDASASCTVDEWAPPHEQEWKPQPVPLPEWAMP